MLGVILEGSKEMIDENTIIEKCSITEITASNMKTGSRLSLKAFDLSNKIIIYL